MAKNKTVETNADIIGVINKISLESRREDCKQIIQMMQLCTGLEPKLWGPSIIGFGKHTYTYESGRSGESPNIAFAPRASSFALYLSANLENRDTLLEQLGKHKTDKGCIHIKTLSEVNKEVLMRLFENHLKHIQSLYPNK